MRASIVLRLLFLPIIGCTTLVPVNTDPSGAKVFVDGVLAGISPCEVGLSGESARVRVEKEGYESAERIVRKGKERVVYGIGTATATGFGPYGRSSFATGTGTQMHVVPGQWPREIFIRLRRMGE